jgi:hypothetical protein
LVHVSYVDLFAYRGKVPALISVNVETVRNSLDDNNRSAYLCTVGINSMTFFDSAKESHSNVTHVKAKAMALNDFIVAVILVAIRWVADSGLVTIFA